MAEQNNPPVANLTASEHESDVDEAGSDIGTVATDVVSTRSPLGLLDLSPELRVLIFHHLLVEPQGINIGAFPLQPFPGAPFPLAIFRTCRLIHEEASQVFYSKNHFVNFLGSRADLLHLKLFYVQSSLLDSFYAQFPFLRVADRIQNIHVQVNVGCESFRVFALQKFLHFMPHLGNPSILRGTLVVDFTSDCRSAELSSFLKWFARALGRFTNFRTVELIFRPSYPRPLPTRATFDPAQYFRLALEPVLGRAEDVTPGRNDGLRFHPVDHRNRSRGPGGGDCDWADLLDGVRLEWNDDSAHPTDSKTSE